MLGQHRGHGHILCEAVSARANGAHETDDPQAIRQRHPARPEQTRRDVQRRGKPRCAQAKASRDLERERHAQQCHVGRHPDRAQQAKGLAVRADQDVLPVVDVDSVERRAPRPAPSVRPASWIVTAIPAWASVTAAAIPAQPPPTIAARAACLMS